MNLKPRSSRGSTDPIVLAIAKAHRILDRVRANQPIEGGAVAWALEMTGDAPLVLCPWPPVPVQPATFRPHCRSEQLRRFMAAMPPLTCMQIADMTGMTRKNVRAHLQHLAAKGEVFIVAEGAHTLFTVDPMQARLKTAPVRSNDLGKISQALRPTGSWEGGITAQARNASIFTLEAA